MDKKSLFLIVLGALVLPLGVSAVPTIAGMAAAIAGQVVLVGTWIVVIMWVVTGVLFLTSSGDPGKIKLARNGLFAAVGGTILIILANGAIAFVANSFGL